MRIPRKRPCKLDDFDPEAIANYGITDHDLDNIFRYLHMLGNRQAIADISCGGYYGTGTLLHEKVELDYLLAREERLLSLKGTAISDFLQINEEAHLKGLIAEHCYLQGKIQAAFNVRVDIGALIWANASAIDFYRLFDYEEFQEPLFVPSETQIELGQKMIARLKRLGKGMPK